MVITIIRELVDVLIKTRHKASRRSMTCFGVGCQTRLGANSRAFKSDTCNTTVTLAVHECIRAHQVWSCLFQHLDGYVTGAQLKITAVRP